MKNRSNEIRSNEIRIRQELPVLKKLLIKFYETQDLSSTHGKPKLLFYDYSWDFFFLQPIAEGNYGPCIYPRDLVPEIIDPDPLCTQIYFRITKVFKTFLTFIQSLFFRHFNFCKKVFWPWKHKKIDLKSSMLMAFFFLQPQLPKTAQNWLSFL